MEILTGKTLDEILKKAAATRQVEIEELKYTIIEEKSGIFGIGSKVTASVYCNLDIKNYIIKYLTNYFNGINMETKVEVSIDNHFFNVNLDSEGNAILIGKNGQTLQAINIVLRTALAAHFKKRIGVLVDINNYKKNKSSKEIYFARKIANEVLKTKTDALLDPMPNDERKAIHAALSYIEGIKTVSEGEGNQRRLKIVYVKKEN
ncbi:MAG: R3H domain-containing nucleic acid-binding protein [Erysipelotrichaceae bacterium]